MNQEHRIDDDVLLHTQQDNMDDILSSNKSTLHIHNNLLHTESDIVHKIKHDSTIKIIEIKGNYNKKTNQELRDLCKQNGLAVRGNKETIIQRLIDNEILLEDDHSGNENSQISSHI